MLLSKLPTDYHNGGKNESQWECEETVLLQTSARLLLCWRTNRMKTCSWAGVQSHGNESCFMQGWSVKLRKLKRPGQPVPRHGDTLVFRVSGTKINCCCHMEGMHLCKSQLFPEINGKTPSELIGCITEIKDFHFKMRYLQFERKKHILAHYFCSTLSIRPQYLLL